MFDESFEEAWHQRFGTPAPEGSDGLARFLAHRSVRDFSEEPVSEGLVTSLVGAAQSSATSSNLQLWSVVSVQEPENRRRLTELCGNQRQVASAPWFFAFFADHYRVARAAAQVGEMALGLDYNEFYTMAVIDAALAAERMVCAAESLGLGICYIGALRNDPQGVQSALGLPEKTFGVFGLCLGWPSDTSTAAIKPRLRQDAVWFRERYDSQVSVQEYDSRMAEFYEREAMKGDVTWSMRSGRRVDEHHLTGRQAIKPFLEEQGFDKR